MCNCGKNENPTELRFSMPDLPPPPLPRPQFPGLVVPVTAARCPDLRPPAGVAGTRGRGRAQAVQPKTEDWLLALPSSANVLSEKTMFRY